MPSAQYSEAQKLDAGALVELYELDTTALTTIYGEAGTGTVYHWTPGNLGASAVHFAGVEYQSMPIEGVDFAWSGQGPIPRPKLRLSNVTGYAVALVIQFGDLVGANVTRLRTFEEFLDGKPGADPSAIFEPDRWTIARKSSHRKDYIEFELASKLDQRGVMLPRRQMLRDACSRTYRVWSAAEGRFVYGSCPYTGGASYTAAGVGTTDPAKDVCGKRLSDCMLRFGQNTPLPTWAFPGIAVSPIPGS